MTLFEIVALYVAINLILAPVLMFRIGQVRIGKKINLGDGGDAIVHAFGMAGILKQGRLIGTLSAILSYFGMAVTLIYLIIVT